MHASTMMQLWIEPTAIDEIATLPGNMRQRIRRAVRELKDEPRPTMSRGMTVPPDLQTTVELRRLRVEHWRIVYVIDREIDLITVLAVRRRPPYNYDDLRVLLGRL